jgi:hypothetical protein
VEDANQSLEELHQIGREAAGLDLHLPPYGSDLKSFIEALKGSHAVEMSTFHTLRGWSALLCNWSASRASCKP